MVDIDSQEELSHQVSARATRAGIWMTATGAALFVAGLFAGLAIDRQLMGEPIRPADQVLPGPEAQPDAARQKDEEIKINVYLKGDPEPGSPEMLDAVARRVREVLKLDENQERKVRAIIDKYHPRMEALRKRFEPELRGLAGEAIVDLWPILQADQRARLERILGRHGRWLIHAVTQPASAPSVRSDESSARQ